MDERDYLILKYLSRFKNITKTANALFMSQPALTRRIKQMSVELGSELIQSTNKGVQLTLAGQEAAKYAEASLRALDGLKERLEVINKENNRLLRISAPNIICEHYMPSLIHAFKKEHEEIRIVMNMMPTSKVITALKRHECDFGFIRNDFGWEDNGKILLTTNFIAAVSTEPFELQDLATMNRVAYTTDTYYMKMLDLWWDNHFSTPPHVEIQVNSLNLCREMVFNGFGFGLLPSVLIPDSPRLHKIILRDRNNVPIERHTYFIYSEEAVNTPLKREFLDFIRSSDFSSFLLLKKYPSL